MIEKMKKLTFLVTNKEYEQFLEDIRKIGVVHIAETQKGAVSDQLRKGLDIDSRYKNCLKILENTAVSYVPDGKIEYSEKAANVKRGIAAMEETEKLDADRQKIKREIENVEGKIETLQPWGNFELKTLKKLEQYGYKAYFYACPLKSFKNEWKEKYYATEIGEANKKIHFIAFSDSQPDIDAERIDLPDHNLAYYKERHSELKKEFDCLNEKIYKIAKEDTHSIEAAQLDNENDIDLSKVHLNTESIADDHVKMMTGWVMEKNEDELIKYLDDNNIFYELRNPEPGEDVPIKLKNNWYTTLFEPIQRMYSLPNYEDLDITPFMAPFFMLFFGLCMGDAGYGVLILILSLIAKNKLTGQKKNFAYLGIILGITTIICGLLTGTLFGIDLSQQNWAFLAPVKKYFINENNFKLFGYSPMMIISIIIGLVQVLFGMVLAAIKSIRRFGWIYGVSKLSWVVGLLAAIACFGLPACGVALPVWLKYVLYVIIGISVLGIFFFNSPKKNILVNFGTGVWDTYGMATGLLGDLLSYIRLFALGLTGGVLGSVFNTLAVDMTSSMSWSVRWLPMLLILLAGHGINFALCIISSFVHPMRLTFVEFFKNSEFEGGGKDYDPFRVKTYNENASDDNK